MYTENIKHVSCCKLSYLTITTLLIPNDASHYV